MNSDDVSLLFEAALNAHLEESFSEAIELWERLLTLEPDRGLFHLFKGWTLMELALYEEALLEFQIYSKSKPLIADGAKAMFTALGYLGRFDEANRVAFDYRSRFKKCASPEEILKPKQVTKAREWIELIDTFDDLDEQDLESAKAWYLKFGTKGLREYRQQLLQLQSKR